MTSLQERQEMRRFISIMEGTRLVSGMLELFFQFVLHINNPTHMSKHLWLQRFTILVLYHTADTFTGFRKIHPSSSTGLSGSSHQ